MLSLLCRCLLLLALVAAPALAQTAGNAYDWATYGYDIGRSSFNPAEIVLDVQNAPSLQPQWSADLGAAITAQPIVVHNAVVGGVPTELVYVGAANGVFAAFDASTGQQVWHRQLLTETIGCSQQPNGVFGVADTAVHDPATHLIYVVDGQGMLYALDDATGETAPGWPIQVMPHPDHEFVWSALTLVNGRILVENASYCDIAPYTGFVLSVDTATRQIAQTFAVTTIGDGGGIWGYGGAAIDPATQAIYVATGNGLSSETSGYSEDVIRLDPALSVVASNYAGFTGGDVDYGATPLLYSTPCNNQLAAVNKSGVLVTYDRDNIGAGPLQKLQIGDGGGPLIGDLAQDPTTGLIYVANPDDSPSGAYSHGANAFAIDSACQLQPAWLTPFTVNRSGPLASPSGVPGVVFFGSGGGNALVALNSANGTMLWSSGSAITGPVYTAPAVIGGQVFVGSWDNHLHAFAVPPSPVEASVLPVARSVAAGTPTTVFATMLNTGIAARQNCRVALPGTVPGVTLTYQTTDPATNTPTGQPNQPVSIAAGGSQSFVLSMMSSTALSRPAQGLVFVCDGVANTAPIVGVNTLDLSFSASPVADIVVLAATASRDGVLRLPGAAGTGAFAVAADNVGVVGDLTVTADLGGAALPIGLSVCETDSSSGQCLAPPAASVAVSIAAGATPTFSVFATASGAVPFAPGASRIFLRFSDAAGQPHGATSVAVTTG
jgi:outer membrane protein assembly factor BamB